MAHVSTISKDEEDLRYWLANEDWYPSQFTRQWLERTPPEEANATLARIAQDAQPEPRAFWSVAITFSSIAGLTTSDGMAGSGPGARKAGTRAALLLVQRNDARGVAPLIRVSSAEGLLQSKYQEQIEQELTAFLQRNPPADSSAPYLAEVRQLATRLWQAKPRDVSPAHADLLSAALHFLHTAGDPASRTLLQTIADTPTRTPNRTRITEEAVALLTEQAV